MDLKILFICFISIFLISAEKISYEGYKLYKVVPKTDDQVKILKDIKQHGLGVFWDEDFVVNNNVKIMVSSENDKTFVEIVNTAEIELNIVMENVQRAIDDQLKSASINSRDSFAFHSLTWNSYHTIGEINAWLDELVEAYPEIVTPVVLGTSVENRTIKGIVINYYPFMTRPSVGVIESTIHAREWITAATVTWIIREFLTSNDPEIRNLAEMFEWHIFPVVNPDGYAYTFSSDRMWRKNRNPNSFTSCNGSRDDMSNGVDLNRNFDIEWNTASTSPDPCSNLFPGTAPFSEPETEALARYLKDLNQRSYFCYYLAFHSFTQLVVIPYSHMNRYDAVFASNYANTYEVAIKGADRLKSRYGTEYTVGVSPDVMYAMSGTSFDWVKSEIQVPISYLLELRDLGDYGFLLPPSQIIPTGLETMDFLVEMNKNAHIAGVYGPASSANSLYTCAVFVISLALIMMLR